MSDQPVARLLPPHRTHKHRINAHTVIHTLDRVATVIGVTKELKLKTKLRCFSLQVNSIEPATATCRLS
jgi:hypothetical protein